ncbi:MAG: MGMT family protein, partial [Candidatus Lokiarchaeota archaeon]|nr:MGMT family protein [Candidatus Lokiarchaeota archaeon]
PIIIPCHRVINKNGKIGGFMGSNNDESTINLKRKLIKLEKNSRM